MSLIVQCLVCKEPVTVPESKIGQSIQCPKCEVIFPVKGAPGAHPGTTAAKPAQAPVKRQAPDRQPIQEDDNPAPVRRSGGRGKLLLILFFLGLAGGAAGGYYGLKPFFRPTSKGSEGAGNTGEAKGSGGPISDLQYLPQNPHVLASVTVPALLGGPAYLALKEAGAGLDSSDYEQFRRFVGVAPSDVQSMVIGAHLSEKPELVVIVHTTKPVRATDLRGQATEPKQSKVGSQTVFDFGDHAFFLPEEKTVVLGEAPALIKILERDAKADLPSGLKKAYHPTNDTWALWLAIDASVLSSPAAKAVSGAAPQIPPAMSDAVKSLVIESPNSSPLEFQLTLRCKDEPGAQAIYGQLMLLQGMLRDGPMAEDMKIPAPALSKKGSSVLARINLPPALFVEPLKDRKWSDPEFALAQLTSDNANRRKEAEARLLKDPSSATLTLSQALRKDDIKTRLAALNLLEQMGPRGTGALTEVCRVLTGAKQPQVRKRAVETLVAMKLATKDEVLAPLLQAQGDADKEVATAATQALEKFGPVNEADKARLAALAVDLKADPRVRGAALKSLVALGSDPIKLMPTLTAAAKDANKDLRASAVEALGRIGPAQRDAVFPLLLAALKDADADVRTGAVAGLDNLGAPTAKEVAGLLELFKDATIPSPVRVSVARALGRTGANAGKDVVGALIAGLAQNDAEVRSACVSALAMLPPPDESELPVLARELNSATSSPEVKRYALNVLAKLGSKLNPAKIPDLSRTLLTLAQAEGELAESALQALAVLGPLGDGDIPTLLGLLKNPKGSAKARGFAAKALAPRGANPDVALALLEALKDEDPGVRKGAAEGLAQAGLKSPEAIAAFTKAVEDKEPEVRRHATTALSALPPESRPFAALLKAYEDEEEAVVRQAALALAKVDKPTKAELEMLAGALVGRKLRLKLYALTVLAEQGAGAGAGATEPLVLALRDANPVVRRLAISSLRALGEEGKGASPALVAALKDADPLVKTGAGAALVKMKKEPKEAIPVLLDASMEKDNPGQKLAAEALGQLGDWAKPVVGLLIARLEKEEQREGATVALGSIGKEAVPDLVKALEKTKDNAIKVAILQAIETIGNDARSALQTVNTLSLQSKSPEVKEAAKKASQAIQKKK